MKRVEIKRIYEKAKNEKYPVEYLVIQNFMNRFSREKVTFDDVEMICNCCGLEKNVVEEILRGNRYG